MPAPMQLRQLDSNDVRCIVDPVEEPLDNSAIEEIQSRGWIESKVTLNTRTVYILDSRFARMLLANRAPHNIPVESGRMLDLNRELRKAMAFYLKDEIISNLRVTIKHISFDATRIHHLFFDNVNVEHLEIDNVPFRISGQLSSVRRLTSSQRVLNLNQLFPIRGVNLEIIEHNITGEGSNEIEPFFSSTDISFDFLYTEATNINLKDMNNPFIALSPSHKDCKLTITNVHFTFNKDLIQRYLIFDKIKIQTQSALSKWFNFYFKSSIRDSNPGKSRFDLGMKINCMLAEGLMKRLFTDTSILISAEDYSRFVYYFNSRGSWIRRLLYWFNGSYYNIGKPLAVLVLSLISMGLALWFDYQSLSNMFFMIDFKSLFEKYLFANISWELGAIAPAKYLFGTSLILSYYSLFCAFLGMKRRYGFPAEIS